MSSLINHLKPGTIINCDVCTGPIKDIYFTHLCEFNPRRVQNGIPVKVYCFGCLNEKDRCKKCQMSYLAKFSMSL